MNRIAKLIPHISFSLSVAFLIVVYLDRRNPMMGFLLGAPFTVLAALTGVFAIASACLMLWGSKGETREAKKTKNNT